MTTAKYIILEDSESSIIKRFKVIAMKTPKRRTDNVDFTLSGKMDKAAGSIISSWEYTLRIPYSSTDSDYGTYDDLVSLYELNNPNGTPNDIITLTDHYGDIFEVIFVGDMVPTPLTTQLEGPNAWFIVPITLIEVPPEGSGSGS